MRKFVNFTIARQREIGGQIKWVVKNDRIVHAHDTITRFFKKKKKGSRREDERRKKEKEITDRWWSVIVTRCWRRKKRIFRRWFVRRGEHFSKGGWYRAQKHPKILASVGRRAMHYSRGCAHVPRSPCLRMYYIRRACARWRHCARRAAPRRKIRGTRPYTRAADGHQTPGSCKHTRCTPACSHTLCRCTGLADATDSITPTGYWRPRFFKLLFLTSNLISVQTMYRTFGKENLKI